MRRSNVDKESRNGQIDLFDRRIIEALQIDGRLSITNLAKKVGMSKSPCQVRFRKLISNGFILGFRAILNPVKLDMDHVAFAEVKLLNTTEAALKAFNEAVLKIAEVEQCYLIAGPFDYLLKVRTKDIKSYRHVLGERISALPHVASSSTYVSMEAVKEVGSV